MRTKIRYLFYLLCCGSAALWIPSCREKVDGPQWEPEFVLPIGVSETLELDIRTDEFVLEFLGRLDNNRIKDSIVYKAVQNAVRLSRYVDTAELTKETNREIAAFFIAYDVAYSILDSSLLSGDSPLLNKAQSLVESIFRDLNTVGNIPARSEFAYEMVTVLPRAMQDSISSKLRGINMDVSQTLAVDFKEVKSYSDSLLFFSIMVSLENRNPLVNATFQLYLETADSVRLDSIFAEKQSLTEGRLDINPTFDLEKLQKTLQTAQIRVEITTEEINLDLERLRRLQIWSIDVNVKSARVKVNMDKHLEN